MNLTETAQLLALASAYDGRDVSETDVRAWQALLDGVRLEEARQAVLKHYGAHPWRVMPSHVLDVVREVRATPPMLADAWEYPPGVVGDPDAEKAHRATRGLSW